MLGVVVNTEYPDVSLLLCAGIYLLLIGAYLLTISTRVLKKIQQTDNILRRMGLSESLFADVFRAILKTSEEDTEWIILYAKNHSMDTSRALKYLALYKNCERATNALHDYQKSQKK